MGIKIESVNPQNIGIKAEGDLGELEIIDESSDYEEDIVEDTNNDGLAGIPGVLIKKSAALELSNIIVKDSENVRFGNNTYFNGPVTIKQVIQTENGIVNSSYIHSEDEQENKQSSDPINNSRK